MTSVLKNVYIDKLVNKYNNTYDSTIKMKPADVKSNTYIDSSKKTNDNNPRFKIGYNVRISKYKSIFADGHVPNQFEKVFVINKVKNSVRLRYIISDLKGEKIAGTFCENELQKTNKKNQN